MFFFFLLSFNYANIHAISPMIYYFLYTTDILEQKLISHGHFQNMNAHFAGNVAFYDAVNIIHDVITTRNPIPYTAKFMFVGVRNNETQQIRR